MEWRARKLVHITIASILPIKKSRTFNRREKDNQSRMNPVSSAPLAWLPRRVVGIYPVSTSVPPASRSIFVGRRRTVSAPPISSLRLLCRRDWMTSRTSSPLNHPVHINFHLYQVKLTAGSVFLHFFSNGLACWEMANSN